MIYEKLFLDKIKDVFINENTVCKLKQHQKDGLRSLYLHYKKKKPGYIVNDPYGNRTQVAILLTAIKRLTVQPILIICDDVEKWKVAFCSWTDDITDVLFNSNKLFFNKKIFINSLDEAVAVGCREWSIVVVDNADCSVQLFRQLKGLKAEFKIVVTSVDLKENYKTFSTIYEWIDPAEKLGLDRMCRRLADEKGTLNRMIMLDWYLQDKVIRRNDIDNISDSYVEHRPKSRIATAAPTKPAPKKNKDATGTKVKKSKPKPITETVYDTPTDSSRFEFDTMTDPHANNVVNVEEKLGFSGSPEKEKANTVETEINMKAGGKRKRLRIIESDNDSDLDDRPENVSKETEIESLNATIASNDDPMIENGLNSLPHKKILMMKWQGNINEIDDSSSSASHHTTMKDSSLSKQGEVNEITQGNFELLDNERVSNAKQNELKEISPALFTYNETDNVDQNKRANEIFNVVENNNELENDVKAHEDVNNEQMINHEILNKDVDPVLTESCSKMNNSSMFEDNIKALEEKTYNKFKGSVLDSLF